MKPTETGVPFGVDKKAWKKAMGENRMKIWKHRAALVWNEFDFAILIAGFLLFGETLAFFIAPRMPFSDGPPWWVFGFLFAVIVFMLFAVVLLIYQVMSPGFDRIKGKWNP